MDGPANVNRGYQSDDGEHFDHGRSQPSGFRWKGEKHQFPMWYKMICSACRTKRGLVRRIVCQGLTLPEFLGEVGDGDDRDEFEERFEYANTWLCTLIGRPLFHYEGSTAYSLFNSHPAGEGIAVLEDFKIFFDGNTAEEREDIEDQWRALTFGSDGVTGLATYLGMHKSYVDR